MTKCNNTNHYKILVVLISSILLVYVLIRAYTLSFTHDESLSFTLINGDNTWSNTANNHLLNTMLMSLSKTLFGISELSLRLPNVLLFIVYLMGCFFIFRTSKKIWLSFFGLIMILFNPFLIEFFSLARGYGLSLGFMLLSIFFLIRNENHDLTTSVLLQDFALTSLFASLAIYSNLAIINFFICTLIIFSIRYWFFKKINNINLIFKIKFWSIFFIATVPIFLRIKRLMKLKEAGQLYFGASSFIEGFDSLAGSSIYLKEYTSLVIPLIKISIALFLFISILYVILKKKFNGALFIMTMLIALLMIGLFIEHYIFEAKYPTSRTALFYIPIISIFIYHLFLDFINQYEIKAQYYIPIILCIVAPILINFVSGANLSFTKTWKYDAHTKTVMKIIRDNTNNINPNLTISNHWLFEPTINYYINRWDMNLNPTNRAGININSDYIYRLQDNSELDGFKVVHSFNDIKSDLLMKTETNN